MDRRPTILIVDDEPYNVDFLEQELEDLNYDTASAFDGREALAKVAAEPPDLVLLDIMMPYIDGYEVLARLKADRTVRDIPVIVISAIDELESAVKAIELGAEDYLPKPFDPTLLQARISASLEKKQWRDREQRYLLEIEAERNRADELLHVILPGAIVDELKANNQVQPRHFDNVAVLFADVVDFTPYCEIHTPEEIVNNLQQMITAFEEAALRFGLQKIKTNGDAFIAASGLFSLLENPVLNGVRCGLQMVTIARQLPDPWHLRVGIHSGPVLGAIIGHRQYLYDVWGDTVNTAQRIESHGAVDAVNLSEAAWLQVADCCQGLSQGFTEVKGKGRLEIYRIDDEDNSLV
jgi:adenylate cyclase